MKASVNRLLVVVWPAREYNTLSHKPSDKESIMRIALRSGIVSFLALAQVPLTRAATAPMKADTKDLVVFTAATGDDVAWKVYF